MSDMNFEVQRVRAATDRQKAAGIHGTFTLALIASGTTIVTLHDYKLCKTKAGEWYVQSPYRTYDGKNRDTGAMETKKLQYYKLFPNRDDWDKQKPVIALARAEIEKLETMTPATPATAPTTDTPSASAPIF